MDPTDTESMQHELQIMARLAHPNIVRVYGGCMRPPNLFVVEEIMASPTKTTPSPFNPSNPSISNTSLFLSDG